MSTPPAAYVAAQEFNNRVPVGTAVKAYPGTRDDAPLLTRTRTSAWPLPSGTAVVSVRGYAGGIALDHIDVDESKRPVPPSLEFSCPPCPMCDKETDSDGDGFTCHRCAAYWGTNGEHGSWLEWEEPGCQSVIEPFNTETLAAEYESIRHNTERCILPLSHDPDKHRGFDAWTTWDDDDPRVLVKAVP